MDHRLLTRIGVMISWTWLGLVTASAAEVRVAAAANFAAPAAAIAEAFSAETGHEVRLSFGASGLLYAQITQGAPFDVLLSADQARPQQLVADGLAVAHSQFTYAVGQLVLWSADAARVVGPEVLRLGSFDRLAIADPALAPYGKAALETIEALGLGHVLRPKLVTGTSIAQTLQFVASGNAELGFVALSQLLGTDSGARWVVPQRLHTPIRQDAVILSGAADHSAAASFIAFLKGDAARAIIASSGYAEGAD